MGQGLIQKTSALQAAWILAGRASHLCDNSSRENSTKSF
jgi:hypothetical protein